ncbi:MAG: hypothetical protein H7Y17_09965 [Chlorobia bacterium]|nr:hypothetical protein [Fimbriimonadaceae bacterium]
MLTFGWVKCQVGKIGDQLPKELAALKKMGVPTEPADLAPNPPIPTGQNAGVLLEELIAELKELRNDANYKKAYNELSSNRKANPEDNPLVVTAIAQFGGYLKKADRLGSFRRLDFHRDYSLGASLMFPEYADIKEIAKWQAARSRLYIKEGNLSGSLSALRSIFAMARQCFDEPTIISALVGIAIDAIGQRAFETHLEAIKANQPALAEARNMLESFQSDFNLKWSLAGEVIMGRIYIQSLRKWNDAMWMDSEGGYETEPSRPDPIDRMTLGDPSVRRMFEAKYLELWRKAHEQMPKSNSDWKGIGKAMATIEKTLENDNSAENYLNQILYPVFGQFANAAGLFQARYRLSLLSIRLLQDRVRGLPTDLTRYGQLAIDPMDGKPIRYIRKGGGFKIWSVGRDEVDNKGAKYYPGSGMSNQNVDEVMYFFYPEKAPPPRFQAGGMSTTTPIGGPPTAGTYSP